MKKVLFATTALIATASMAAAEVRLSGYGRFGLAYNENNSENPSDPNFNGLSETNITSRFRLQVDVSAETDGGVAFDGRVRMQSENRNGNPARSASTGSAANGRPNNRDNGFNGARFGVSYNGLRVNVGNIIGAIENTPGLYTTGTRSAGTGIDGMGFQSVAIKTVGGTTFNWTAYDSDGMGSNGVEVLYSAGGFTGHLSYAESNGTTTNGTAFTDGPSRTGIMLTYSFGDYYVSGSYQSASNTGTRTVNGVTYEAADGLYFLAAGGDFGAFGARLAYGSTDEADSITLEGNMDIGAASNLLIWVNNTSVDDNLLNNGFGTAVDGTAVGINYQYDLGGGSTFVAGYVNEADGDNQFQAGVYFNF